MLLLAVVAFIIVVGACSGGSTDDATPTGVVPTEGNIKIVLNTAGVNTPGTVNASIDDVAVGVVVSGSSQTLGPYPLGDHEVRLDIPQNCTFAGSNPRALSIVSDATILTAETTYDLTCN